MYIVIVGCGGVAEELVLRDVDLMLMWWCMRMCGVTHTVKVYTMYTVLQCIYSRVYSQAAVV